MCCKEWMDNEGLTLTLVLKSVVSLFVVVAGLVLATTLPTFNITNSNGQSFFGFFLALCVFMIGLGITILSGIPTEMRINQIWKKLNEKEIKEGETLNTIHQNSTDSKKSSDPTKDLNARVLFLTLIVAFATIFSLLIQAFSLLQSELLLGLGITVIFVITIFISAYCAAKWTN
jgi:hypothetical protein